MTPLTFTIIAFAISFGAGVLGSLLGLGGGIIVVPALTLLLHIDIRPLASRQYGGVIDEVRYRNQIPRAAVKPSCRAISIKR